ncbi:MAG: hypothetical protein WC683_14150 [bacterium]
MANIPFAPATGNAPALLGRAGGGESAVGRVAIDTSQLGQAVRAVEVATQQIGRAFQTGQTTVRRAIDGIKKDWADLQKDLRRLQVATLPLAGLAVGGLAAAQNIKALSISIQALGGDLDEIRGIAEEFGLPFVEFAEGARALIPQVRRANANLRDTLIVSQQLQLLNPLQGIRGAAFGLSEFLAGQYRSLVFRFNLDSQRLQRILADAGGSIDAAVQGLSAYLGEIGLTTDALREFGEQGLHAFSVMRDEMLQTLAEAFTPLLNDIVLPMVRGFSDLVRQLRETNPELLRIAAAITSIVGLISAASFALGPLIALVGGIFTNPIALAGLAVIGAGAASLIATARAQNLSFGETIRLIIVTLADVVGEFAATILEAGNFIARLFEELAGKLGLIEKTPEQAAFEAQLELVDQAIADMESALRTGAEVPQRVSLFLHELFGGPGLGQLVADLVEAGEATGYRDAALIIMQRVRDELVQQLEEAGGGIGFRLASPQTIQALRDLDITAGEFLDTLFEVNKTLERTSQIAQETVSEGLAPTVEQLELFSEYLQEVAELEARRNEQIAEIREEAAEREAEENTEHQERLIELQSEAHEREAQNLKNYQRQEARARAQHRRSLFEAAARLDAIAVRRELESEAERREQAKEDFEEQRTQERENLQERIDDEIKTHNKRLAEQRKADEKRIREIIETTNKEIADRKQKYIDANLELAVEAGQHQFRMLGIQRLGQEGLEDEYEAFWDKLIAEANARVTSLSLSGQFRAGVGIGAGTYTAPPLGNFMTNTLRKTGTTRTATLNVGQIVVNGSNLTPKQLQNTINNTLRTTIKDLSLA